MEKRLKISSIISLVLAFISVAWLVYNFAMYELLRPLVLGLEPIGHLEHLANFIWIGCIVFFNKCIQYYPADFRNRFFPGYF
jgi:hypothetical protein